MTTTKQFPLSSHVHCVTVAPRSVDPDGRLVWRRWQVCWRGGEGSCHCSLVCLPQQGGGTGHRSLGPSAQQRAIGQPSGSTGTHILYLLSVSLKKPCYIMPLGSSSFCRAAFLLSITSRTCPGTPAASIKTTRPSCLWTMGVWDAEEEKQGSEPNWRTTSPTSAQAFGVRDGIMKCNI